MKENTERISLFLPVLVGGGAERVMVNLAAELVKLGRDVDFVVAMAEGPYLKQVPREVRIVDLKSGRTRKSLPGLTRYLKEVRPAALISGLDIVNILSIWSKRLAGVSTKSIITLHNTFSEKIKGSSPFSKGIIIRHLMTRYYPRADEIVAVSKGVADDYLGIMDIPSERVSVINNPVINPTIHSRGAEPVNHPWFSPGSPPVILSVGRLTEQKNYADLIKAVAMIKDRRQVRLMILGEGELREPLERLIAELGLNEQVSLPGFVDNPYQYMARCAVFALSSKWEGLPTVLIEAMAFGVPVVSYNCRSGPEEILQKGRLGRLVPVDAVEQLADAILDSLDDRAPRYTPDDLRCYQFDYAAKQYLKLIEGQ